MKKIIPFLIILASCNEKTTSEKVERQDSHVLNNGIIHEIRLDSCEYLVAEKYAWESGVTIIHKANCDNHKK